MSNPKNRIGAKEKIWCRRCDGYTNHTVIAHEEQSFCPENTPGMQIDFAEGVWEMLKCDGCCDVTFKEEWCTSEDFDPQTGRPEKTVTFYPRRGKNLLAEKPLYNPPRVLRRIYKEVLDCYNNENYTLAAAGIRALIEGVCADHNIKNGPVTASAKGAGTRTVRKATLVGKIEGLGERGILTEKHKNSLHDLRFLGNDALHEFAMPSANEVKIALEIVEHTLENLYEIDDKVARLRACRTSRKKEPKKMSL